MESVSCGDLISVEPKVCRGEPCVRDTRVLVSSILSQLAAGQDFERIKAGYPELADDYIRAAIEYARRRPPASP